MAKKKKKVTGNRRIPGKSDNIPGQMTLDEWLIEAREMVCNKYMSYATGLVQCYVGENWNYDTAALESEAAYALLKAFETYDPRKGTEFKTYLSACVKNALIGYVRRVNRETRRTVSYEDMEKDVGGQGSVPWTTDYGHSDLQYSIAQSYEKAVNKNIRLGIRCLQARSMGIPISRISEATGYGRRKLYRAMEAAKTYLKEELAADITVA